MTRLVFSYDVEDFVNAPGAEGVRRYAEILRENGAVGCFNIVARIAQAFLKWGRQDVVDALKHHEIDLHSYAHTYHPTINEYTDIEDYDEALRRFMEEEGEACRIITEIFGKDKFPAACPPGCSTSYVAHYGYHKLGVPVYAGDTFADSKRNRPVHICNLAALDYDYCLDQILLMERDEIDAILDKIYETKDVAILYHHPQMSYVTEFWDQLNFWGKNTPEEEWVMSPARDPKEIELYFSNFRYLVEKVMADDRFMVTTYEEIAETFCGERAALTPDMLPEIKAQLDEELFPVTTPESYCLSDILLACRDFLLGESEHKCGTVYGFLSTPYAVTEATTVTAEALRASAAQIGEGFLPEKITVGDTVLGPADWLRAALEVLSGKDTVTVEPGPWQLDLDQFPLLRDLKYDGEWMHWDQLKDEYLSDRLRTQSWTIRLPRGTERKVM